MKKVPEFETAKGTPSTKTRSGPSRRHRPMQLLVRTIGAISGTHSTHVRNIMIEHARDGRRESRPFRIPAVATMAVALFFGTMTAAPAGAQAPAHTGSLSVKKVVINNSGGPITPPPTFATTTHCSQNAATLPVHTPVAVPGNTTVAQPGQINTGLICSVTEVVPPPIKGLAACKGRDATWTAAYSPPETIVTGQTALLTVTNTLTCNPPTGGTLQIHKSVVNTLNVPTPPSFNMVASCTGMSPVPVTVAVNGTVTVPPAGQIAGGTVCTITETLPPPVLNVKACQGGSASWVASNPGPLTVQVAQTTGTIITNTLTCDKAPAGGHLTVYKVVVNSTGGAAPIPPVFNVTAHCTLGGAPTLHVTLPAPANGGVSAAPPVALGSTCSITEGPLPSIANLPACKGATASWTKSYSGPVTISGGAAATLTATNTLRCDPSSNTGSLKVIKSVVNATGGPAPIPATFGMTATCTTGPNPAFAVAPGATGTTVNGIAAPNQCAVSEERLFPIAMAEGCRGPASWTTAYSPAQPVAITAGGTTTVTVRNTLTCDKPTNVGSLRVIKSVANSTGGPVTMPAAFAMTVTCTPSGPTNQPISVPQGSTGTTVSGIAAPSQCTVTETPLASILHAEGCQGGSASWSTAYSPAQTVAITAGGTTTVAVRNTLTCDKPTSGDCPNPGMSTIGCRVTVTIKRSKGPNIYSVLASPAATSPTPTPNIAPSTSASCVIAGMAMINHVACWFNYSTNPTPVTLTATSSAGALPAGFFWSGACSGSSPTCPVSAKLIMPPSVIANFP